jgi:Spy/CpxP family protein refolding chaperone
MKRTMLLMGVFVSTLATLTYAAAPDSSPATTLGTGKWAQTPLGKMISGNFGRLLTLRSELDLTDEQRQQVRTVIKSHRSEILTTVKSVRDARTQLRDIVMKEDVSETDIRSAADNLGKAIADASVQRAKLRQEIVPIFTAEQQKQVRDFLAENDAAVDKFLTQAATAH